MGGSVSMPGYALDGRVRMSDREFNGGYCPDEVPRRRRGLRILCLHGSGSNNDITDMQVNFLSLRDVQGVACDLFEATVQAPMAENNFEDFSDRAFFTWFDTWSERLPWADWPGAPGGSLHTSLLRAMATIQQHGPFDGLYGFSQGALVVTMLSSETVWRGLFGLDACPWRFVICANAGGTGQVERMMVAQAPKAGAGAGAAEEEAAEEAAAAVLAPIATPVKLPSFHLLGQRDYYYMGDQQALLSMYEAPASYSHAAGHELPLTLTTDESLTKALDVFLSRFAPLPIPLRHAPPSDEEGSSFYSVLWGGGAAHGPF